MQAHTQAPPAAHRRRGWRAGALALAAVTVLGGAAVVVNMTTASAATVDTSAWYVLVNRNSGKALDVYNFATNDGARITQWTRSDGANQQWQFVDSGGGYYRLKSKLSGQGPGRLQLLHRRRRRRRAVDRPQRHQPAVAARGLRRRLRPARSTATAARPSRCRAPPPPTAATSCSTPTGAATTSSGSSSASAAPRRHRRPRRPRTYTRNPVVWQDFADGDIIRVGDAYYYSASTMHYSPGAPILRSYDLVQLGVRRALGARASTSAPAPTT